MTDDLIKRLRDITTNDDHERGCPVRFAACECGYDERVAALLNEAADALSPPSPKAGEREDFDTVADYIRDELCCPRIHGCELAGMAECPAERVRALKPPEPKAGEVEEMAGTVHDLKTHPEAFAAVRAGLKPWELRLNDRNFQVGDGLHLAEWSPISRSYTGETEDRVVTWVLHGGQFGLPEGYVIMSMRPLADAAQALASAGYRRVRVPSVEEVAKAMWNASHWLPDMPTFAHETEWDDPWPKGYEGFRQMIICQAQAILSLIGGE